MNARDRIGNGPVVQRQGQLGRARPRRTCTATRSTWRGSATADQGHRAHREGRADQGRRRQAERARHPHRLDNSTAARSPTAPITPATTGRATAPAPRRSATTIAPAVRRHLVELGPREQGCSQENLVGTGGAGLFYCFSPGTANKSYLVLRHLRSPPAKRRRVTPEPSSITVPGSGTPVGVGSMAMPRIEESAALDLGKPRRNNRPNPPVDVDPPQVRPRRSVKAFIDSEATERA